MPSDGCLELVDWNTGLEYWNGLNCCKKSFSWYGNFIESGYSVTSLMCSMPCLGVLPQSLGIEGHMHI